MSSVRVQLRSAIRNHPNLFRHPKRLTIPKRLTTTWGSTVRARPVGVSYTFLPEPRAIDRPDPPPFRLKRCRPRRTSWARSLRSRRYTTVSRGCSGHRPVAPTHPFSHSHRIAVAPSPTLPAVDGPDFIYTSYNISTTKHIETPLHITKR